MKQAKAYLYTAEVASPVKGTMQLSASSKEMARTLMQSYLKDHFGNEVVFSQPKVGKRFVGNAKDAIKFYS